MAPAKNVLPSIPSVPIDEMIIFFKFCAFFKILKTNSWFLPPDPFPITSTVVSPPKIRQLFCSSDIFSMIVFVASFMLPNTCIVFTLYPNSLALDSIAFRQSLLFAMT